MMHHRSKSSSLHTIPSLVILLMVSCIFFLAQDCTGSSPPGLLGAHNRVVVCYVSSWAAYRQGRGAFSLENLDPRLCTHLVYAFAGLNVTSSTLRSLDPYRDLEEDYGLGWYKKLTGLKNRFPHLKVTLAVGGWNEGSKNYSIMAADPKLRQNFVQSVVSTLMKHNFDGFDLDWEFPGSRGGSKEDKRNFVQLVKELRHELAPRNLLITAAMGASQAIINEAYDVPALGSLLDLMHIMCYDYHGSWDSRTLPNAPLNTKDSMDPLSVTATIKHLKSLGAPANKLVLGVPMYGRTFTLSATGGELQTSTHSHGDTICMELKSLNSSWKTAWDSVSKTPYAQDKERWLSYDDERSIAEKAKYAIDEKLAGVMVWAIDTDDFHGDCSSGGQRTTFPLVTELNVAMVKALDDHQQENEVHVTTHSPGSSAASTGATLSAFVIASVTMLIFSSGYFKFKYTPS
ncbi:hypothetical protein B566_EDAN011361 [Ephemera danica]|nr:hypothetical protein B566_EDAN011361 [Ephemera danica]